MHHFYIFVSPSLEFEYARYFSLSLVTTCFLMNFYELVMVCVIFINENNACCTHHPITN